MYKDKKILGVITARGGSKGIPRKNIKELAGKPLIAHTIEAAKKSQYLTRCIVSTDDREIAEISRKYGAEIPFMRPAELAQDASTSIEVVQHVLRKLKDDSGEGYDYLMILQPTSPLRSVEDIDESIKLAVDTDADSVMSMKELDDFASKKVKKIEDGVVLPYFENEGTTSSRRQDLKKMYKRNCAIYLTKTGCIMEGDLFGKVSRAYVMPEERSVDINKLTDFELAEFLIQKSNNDFKDKWKKINAHSTDADEQSLFVPTGKEPTTQRQCIFFSEYLLVKKILLNHAVSRVLEVGCGRGTMSLYLASYLGLEVSLLDNSSDAIRLAKKEFEQREQKASFFVADAQNSGLPDKSFDVVISVGLAEHFPDVSGLYKEHYRLLKKGGIMISINIPQKFSIQYLNTLLQTVRKLFGTLSRSLKKDYYRNNLKPGDYKHCAEKVGFQDVYFVYACPLPIFTQITTSTDKKITKYYKLILKLRSFFLDEPFLTNALFAQEHLLVGFKKL